MSDYEILMHGETYQNAEAYLKAVQAGKIAAGAYLRKNLNDCDVLQMGVNQSFAAKGCFSNQRRTGYDRKLDISKLNTSRN